MNDDQRIRDGMTESQAHNNGYRLSLDGKTMLDQYGKPATDSGNNVMISDNGTMRREDGK
jgi:hypothetical protein